MTGSHARTLKWLRAKSGLRQSDVARSAGITPQYLSDLERGRRSLTSVRALVGLADAYGVSTDYLLGRVAIQGEWK